MRHLPKHLTVPRPEHQTRVRHVADQDGGFAGSPTVSRLSVSTPWRFQGVTHPRFSPGGREAQHTPNALPHLHWQVRGRRGKNGGMRCGSKKGERWLADAHVTGECAVFELVWNGFSAVYVWRSGSLTRWIVSGGAIAMKRMDRLGMLLKLLQETEISAKRKLRDKQGFSGYYNW